MENIQKGMAWICETHGGPRQFLQTRYDTTEKLCNFQAALLQMLPLRDDVVYQSTDALAGASVEEYERVAPPAAVFHPAMFSFANGGSVKGHPEQNTAIKLTEHLARDGFVTTVEPLLVTSVHDRALDELPKMPNGVTSFSVGFVKGSARMSTLLAILTMFVDDSISLREVHCPSNHMDCHLNLICPSNIP